MKQGTQANINPVGQGLVATMFKDQKYPYNVNRAHSLATQLYYSGDPELALEILRLGGSAVYAQMVDNPAHKTMY